MDSVLRDVHHDLRVDYANQEITITKLREAHRQLQEDVARQERAHRSEVEALKHRLKEAELELSSQEVKGRSRELEYKHLIEKHEREKAQLPSPRSYHTLSFEHEDLTKRYAELVKQFEEAAFRSNSTSTTSANAVLSQRISALEAEKKQLQDELRRQSLQSTASSSVNDGRVSHLEAELSRHAALLDAKHQEIEALKLAAGSQAQPAPEHYESLAISDRASHAMRQQQLASENDTLVRKVAALEARLATAASSQVPTYQAPEMSADRYQAAVARLSEQKKALEEEVAKLKTQNHACSAQNDSLKDERHKLRMRLQQLDTLNLELIEKNGELTKLDKEEEMPPSP